jgi:hypothetical protein
VQGVGRHTFVRRSSNFTAESICGIEDTWHEKGTWENSRDTQLISIIVHIRIALKVIKM